MKIVSNHKIPSNDEAIDVDAAGAGTPIHLWQEVRFLLKFLQIFAYASAKIGGDAQ